MTASGVATAGQTKHPLGRPLATRRQNLWTVQRVFLWTVRMDENGRWIKLHRKLLKSEVWFDHTALGVFLWCIFQANWKPGRLAGVEIPRGSFVTSVRKGAEDTEIPRNTFHKALKRLVDYGCISYEPLVTDSGRRRGLIVTVCKYSTYQDDNRNQGTEGGQPGDKQGTAGGQPGDQIEEPLEGVEGKNKQPPKAPRKPKPVYVPKDGDLPESLAPLAGLWREWVDFRREDIRKPMTQRMAQQQIKQLTEWGPDRAAAAIRNSIASGYTGLFEPKASNGNGQPETPNIWD